MLQTHLILQNIKSTLTDLYNQIQNETTIAIAPNDRPK